MYLFKDCPNILNDHGAETGDTVVEKAEALATAAVTGTEEKCQ
jgi:hypothetical protein